MLFTQAYFKFSILFEDAIKNVFTLFIIIKIEQCLSIKKCNILNKEICAIYNHVNIQRRFAFHENGVLNLYECICRHGVRHNK